jgi:hypothetical protein
MSQRGDIYLAVFRVEYIVGSNGRRRGRENQKEIRKKERKRKELS